MNPLVTVIVRTKDRSLLLKEALDSIQAQTYENIEVVVVNDGGRDVSDLIDRYSKSFKKLKYINHETTKGRASAANSGISAAEGEWVGFLDDDDLLLPKALETLVAHGKASDVVYGMVEMVKLQPDGSWSSLSILGSEFSRESLFVCNYIPTCGLLFRKALVERVGFFDEGFELLEDWDFFYRLSKVSSFTFVPELVAKYRILSSSFASGLDPLREFKWRTAFYKKHFGDLSPEFLSVGYFRFVEGVNRSHSVLVERMEAEKAKILRELSEEKKRAEVLEASLRELKKKFEEEKIKILEELAGKSESLRKEIEARKHLEVLLSEREKKLKDLESLLQEVLHSTSWRVTEPLRLLGKLFRRQVLRIRLFFELFSKFVSHAKSFGLRSAVKKSLAWARRENISYVYLHETLDGRERNVLESFAYKPLISVVVPVYNTPKRFLEECLESVFNQSYPLWELCIADDASTEPHVREVLEKFRERAPNRVKIVYREVNGHISEASNSALSLATGDFVAFLDHDDLLTPDALLEVVKLLNKYPEADVIYSDEDKLLPDGSFSEPNFKPDWSPELLLGQMYACHLSVYRKALVDRVGGFRKGFEGSQDHDLLLRVSELTDRIFHIPKVLYHWRVHSGSSAGKLGAKDYAYKAAKKALEDALERRGLEGSVEAVEGYPGFFRVHIKPKRSHLVSIVIPTRDLSEDLNRCISSIVERSTFKNIEFVIVDNGSREEKTFKTLDYWRKRLGKGFKVIKADIPFNFSKLVNLGVDASEGDVVVLLNNDTELIAPSDWLEEMLGYCELEGVGCVGPFLLYPDGKIQHAGIVLGIGPVPPRVAGHVFSGFPSEHPGYMGRLLTPSNYSAVTGACMMVKKALWEEVGGFDENLAVAFNDVDFCLKLLVKGYRHVVLPQVKFYHHESKSRGYEDTPEKRKRFLGEIDIIVKRWRLFLENDPFYNPNLPIDRYDFGVLI